MNPSSIMTDFSSTGMTTTRHDTPFQLMHNNGRRRKSHRRSLRRSKRSRLSSKSRRLRGSGRRKNKGGMDGVGMLAEAAGVGPPPTSTSPVKGTLLDLLAHAAAVQKVHENGRVEEGPPGSSSKVIYWPAGCRKGDIVKWNVNDDILILEARENYNMETPVFALVKIV